MKPIILKALGEDGKFSLSCATKEKMFEVKRTMAYKGILPIETYKKATLTGVEYILVYSLYDRIFTPIFFN